MRRRSRAAIAVMEYRRCWGGIGRAGECILGRKRSPSRWCDTCRVLLGRQVNRRIERFLDDPGSVRRAAWLVVTASVLVVVLGAVVMWVFDHEEYPNYGRALWFVLQTITTVGYGDVTPRSKLGRLVAGIVMLTAIAFLTVITAAITSTFVEAARRRAARVPDRNGEAIAAVSTRLDRIEEALAALLNDSRPVEPGADSSADD